MFKKVIAFLVVICVLSTSGAVIFADSAKLTTQCISELSAIYTVTEGEYGKLDITANAVDVAEDEYVTITVYASADSVEDPSNSGENGILTMRTVLAKDIIADGKLAYKIDYLSAKLTEKCVVCVQVANRGTENDWAKAYVEVPIKLVTDAYGKVVKEFLAPTGSNIIEWVEDNKGEIDTNDNWNVFLGWKTEDDIVIEDGSLIPITGLSAVSRWWYFGDLDFDGAITVADSLIALRVAARLDEPTDDMILLGDSDKDGALTVVDALGILRHVAKLITSWDELKG